MKTAQSSGRSRTGVLPAQRTDTESLPWNPLMAFVRVSPRHLVTGAPGGDRLGPHHVRIDAGCATGDHVHDGMVETQDAPKGNGTCTRAGTVIACTPVLPGPCPPIWCTAIGAGARGQLPPALFSPPFL